LEKIFINTQGSGSEIIVGANWESVAGLLPEKGVIIVTDENVSHIYGDRLPKVPTLTISPGEGSKNLEVIENLAFQLLEAGIDRYGFILAVGGGVVCDIAGFLASIYMRGIRCGYVSTTLLSQVDASTGGKNGVNLGGTKNMLGNIRQPEFVICDPGMLRTLPEEEYLSGLAELIKTAVIGDYELFEIVEQRYEEIMARDYDLLTLLIAKSVKFKASVVTEDEKEAGLRRILNFGHTLGHAVELHKSVKHGFAVATGIEFATDFSFEKGVISNGEKVRIIKLLERFDLLVKHNIEADQIENLILHDKKRIGNNIHFVFTEGIGRAVVKQVNVKEVMDHYKLFVGKR